MATYIDVSVTGQVCSAAIGAVSVTTVRNISVSVTGVACTALPGTPLFGGWNPIDTAQTPNWGTINTAQTPNWVQITT
jgi:hypothetical protein